MRYLLDTNVVSELIARQPNEGVVRWIDGLDPSGVYLGVITIGEISKGVERLPDSPRKEALREWLTDSLMLRFEGRILEIDIAVMLTWGALTARLERRGRTMPAMDSLIAALALSHELTLATRNESDFEDAEITVVNPWR
ncbi:MAG: type II toxin-antitoxin system VapC family toxin [Rubrobacteraceae bacterium]